MGILVTGATGLLGQDLCRVLTSDEEVVGWARRIGQVPPWPGVRWESVDVTDCEAVLKRLQEIKPPWVIHSAAMTDLDACEQDPQAAHRVNVQGSRNVALGCAQVEAALLAISTDYVFDGKGNRSYREEDPPNPLSVYAKSKWEGEQEVLKATGRSCVVRVSGLFGSGRSNFVTQAVEAFRQRRPVRVVTDQVNSPSYTFDLAHGIKRLIDLLTEAGLTDRIFHLANEGAATRMEVALAIAKRLKASESLVEKTTWAALNRPARRPANSRLDCSRFARLAGGPLRSWRDALQDFLEEGCQV